jgi:hypothetical protein
MKILLDTNILLDVLLDRAPVVTDFPLPSSLVSPIHRMNSASETGKHVQTCCGKSASELHLQSSHSCSLFPDPRPLTPDS